MESISSSSNLGSYLAAEVTKERCYLPLASACSVMWEQMRYLMSHDGSACHPDCPDCKRLASVKKCLLQPFY
jgi:hypothetical protein